MTRTPTATRSSTPSSADVEESLRLDRRARQIQAAESIPYPEALFRAKDQLDAEDRAAEQQPAYLRESADVHTEAVRIMRERPSLTYKEALIEASREMAKTPKRPSSGRRSRPDDDTGDTKPSESAMISIPTTAQVVERASADGISFEDAYQRIYDELARKTQTSRVDAAIAYSDDLTARARTYMADHPGATFRQALLAVEGQIAQAPQDSRSSIVSLPTDAPHKGDADRETQPVRPTVEQINAYAKRKGITYRDAQITLARVLNGMDPDGGQA